MKSIFRVLCVCILVQGLYAESEVDKPRPKPETKPEPKQELPAGKPEVKTPDVSKSDKNGLLDLGSGDKAQLRMMCGKEVSYYTSENSIFLVPKGTHRLMIYTAQAQDKEGSWWWAELFPDRKADVKIEPGKTTTHRMGAPFKAWVSVSKVKKSARTAVLHLNIIGSGGRTFSFRRMDKPGRSHSFQIIDEKGNVVSSGAFRYG